MKRKTLSLRFTVGTMFLIATIFTGSVAVSLQYYFSKTMAMEHTIETLSDASKDLSDHIKNLDTNAVNTARLLASISKLFGVQASDVDLRSTFAEVMRENSQFYSIYVGTQSNDFYQLINLESSSIVREKIAANDADRWVVIKITGEKSNRIRETLYYDELFVLRDKVITKSNYFPTERPWFRAASNESVNKTKPYLFQHLKITGQTYSLPLIHNRNSDTATSVLGIDIVLSSVQDKLSVAGLDLGDLTDVESYLYSKEGKIIASNQVANKDFIIPHSPLLSLSEEQTAAINQHPNIKMSNKNDWVPIDFALSGQPQGYAVDLLILIEQMTGINFEFINGFTWSQLVDKFNNHSLDGMHSLQKNSHIVATGVYSNPLFSFNFGLITDNQLNVGEKYADFKGKKVGILSGWSIIPELRHRFPDVELIEYPDINSGFRAVAFGETSAFLDIEPTLQQGLAQYFYQNLILKKNTTDLNEMFKNEFYILLNREHEALIPIINLALENITPKQKSALKQKWLGVKSTRDSIMVPYEELLLLTYALDNKAQLVERTINGEDKFVYISPVKIGANAEEYFAVVIPQDKIYGKVTERVKISIGITVAFMVLMLPVAWMFGAPIVKPIKQLRFETRKVQERHYEQVEPVDTAIKEVAELSDAIIEMSADLEQYEKSQEEFLEAFIKLIAQAIDDKSAYTAGHCNRVPELGIMLAEAAHMSDSPLFKAFEFKNDDERREFRIAAWLHDCGKITTPEYIVDKGTKLETNYNRIHEIRMRFEVLWRDAENDALQRKLIAPEAAELIDAELSKKQRKLVDDFDFIAKSNVGGEFMSPDKAARVEDIAKQTWLRHFDNNIGLSPVEESLRSPFIGTLPVVEPLLSDKPEHIIPRDRKQNIDPKYGIKMAMPEYQYNLGEIYNLCISRGTLTAEDRYKINEHMVSTIKMLENLPFPAELSRVPRYASTHHETLKGTGYPRKLSADDLSIPERVLVIADIFEALTASDRPYKKAKPISVAVDIMYKMALDEHIDMDLFKLFLETETHLKYAKAYLKEEQLDEVDLPKYLSA